MYFFDIFRKILAISIKLISSIVSVFITLYNPNIRTINELGYLSK